MKKLHYGMDYWDLVTFCIEKGETPKALETLSDHFVKKGDAANLERVVKTALTRKHEV